MAKVRVDSNGKIISSGNRGGGRGNTNNNVSHVFEVVELNVGKTEKRWTPENNESGEYDHAIVKLTYPIEGVGKEGDKVKIIIPALAGGKNNNGIFGMAQKTNGKPPIKPGDFIHVDNINNGYVSNKVFAANKGTKVDALVGQYAGIEAREAQIKAGEVARAHGPMTVSPVYKNGEKSSQTIRMYHSDNSVVVDPSKLVADGSGELTIDEVSALDHKNIDVISDVIREVLKNPKIELGTPGVMIRAIANVADHNENEATRLLRDVEDASPIAINIVGYVPSRKDDEGNTIFAKPEESNAESVIDAFKNSYDSGVKAYVASENGEELDDNQKRQLNFFRGVQDVLERASDNERYIVEVIPTSTVKPGPLSFEGGDRSRASISSWPFQAATRIHALDDNDKDTFAYLPMTGVSEGNLTTAIRRADPTYDGNPIPDDYTVLPNGIVLDENGEKLGTVEQGNIDYVMSNKATAVTTRFNNEIAPPAYVGTKALGEVSPHYNKLFSIGKDIVSESRKKLAEINRKDRENKKNNEQENEVKHESDGIEP